MEAVLQVFWPQAMYGLKGKDKQFQLCLKQKATRTDLSALGVIWCLCPALTVAWLPHFESAEISKQLLKANTPAFYLSLHSRLSATALQQNCVWQQWKVCQPSHFRSLLKETGGITRTLIERSLLVEPAICAAYPNAILWRLVKMSVQITLLCFGK